MADPVLVLNEDDPRCGIKKKIIHAGKGPSPNYPDGTKVYFHYVTKKLDEEHTVLDDSRKTGAEMELYLGKKFKLEVWETCLKSMLISEVASFICDVSLVYVYPVVAKSLRDHRLGKKPEERQHCCGMTLKEHGVGYEDLDALIKNPEPLEFILELTKVKLPGEFEKETWALTETERRNKVPVLKDEGNELYKKGYHDAASKKYAEAIGILETLLLREKPGDEHWKALDKLKIPLLLNYSQCKLLCKDFYPVIEHTTEVLTKDPDNVKALFRRAKAHVGAWNPDDAKADFSRVAELDPSLKRSVTKELQQLTEMEKQKLEEDKQKLKGKMFS